MKTWRVFALSVALVAALVLPAALPAARAANVPQIVTAPLVTNVHAYLSGQKAFVAWTEVVPNLPSQVIVYRSAGLGIWQSVAAPVTAMNRTMSLVSGLTIGTTYRFTVRSTVGSFVADSAPSNVITVGTAPPGSPSGFTATPAPNGATLGWLPAPTVIDHYLAIVYPYPATSTVVTYVDGIVPAQHSVQITGLTAGTKYTLALYAVGITGALSPGQTTTVIPTGPSSPPAPAAPTNVQAVPGNTSVTIRWTAPSTTPAAIDHYAVTVYLGGTAVWNNITTATSVTVGGLVNGQTYGATVRSVSTAGLFSDPVSRIFVPVAPALTPAAPVNLRITPGNGSAVITWSAPSSTPAAINHYRVSLTVGGLAVWSADNVYGLQVTAPTSYSGYTYGVEVRSVSAAGLMSSALAGSFVAATPVVPAAPINLGVVPGDRSAQISWSAPGWTPVAIDHYAVYVYLGPTIVWSNENVYGYSVIASGLVNGQLYSVQVRAVSVSTWTLARSAATQSSFVAGPMIRPYGPVNLHATVGNGSVSLTWSMPSASPAPISYYSVTIFNGSSAVWSNAQVNGTGVTVTGLANGQAYIAEVRSVSQPSWAQLLSDPARLSFVPMTAPGAAQSVHAVAGNGMATVTWLPSYDGGSPITSYVITFTPNPNDVAAVIHPATDRSFFDGVRWSVPVYGLANGPSYTFYVYALNAAGRSAVSSASDTISLATVPGAPRSLSVSASDGSLSVSWTAPATDGGSAITGYRVTASDGLHTPITISTTGPAATLSSLSNATTYTISVVALNRVGAGPATQATGTPVHLAPVLVVPASLSVDSGDQVSLAVTGNAPNGTDRVILSATGLPAGVTFADQGNGSGKVAGSAEVPAGLYTFTISATDSHNATVSKNVALTVTREEALIVPLASNRYVVTVGAPRATAGSVSIGATIREVSDPNGYADIREAAPVTFTLTALSTGAKTTYTADTTGGGVEGVLTVRHAFRNLAPDVYRVQISVGGSWYEGSSYTMFTIYNRTAHGSVSGKGDIVWGNASANFSLKASYGKNGTVQGSLSFLKQRGSSETAVRSTFVGAMIINGNTVLVQGKGTLNGVPNHRFVVTLVSRHAQGLPDRLGLWVIDGKKATVSDLTFSPIDLAGGSIKVKHA